MFLIRPMFAVMLMLAAPAVLVANPKSDDGRNSKDKPLDFSVSSALGDKSFHLADARGKFVLLHFLLKTDCPLCANHVRDYLREAPKVAGVVHVFLKPDSAKEIQDWTRMLAEDAGKVTLYRDEDANVAKLYRIPDGYAFHGQKVHYPAAILLDGRGVEVFRHVGKDNRDRLKFSDFAAKVRALTRNSALEHYNITEGKPAIQGYDPVAYVGGKPEKGRGEFTSEYRGVTYWFTSAENRAKFAADPGRFAPAYGGWCATAMADGGRKVDIDPENFKVADERLLLFYKGWLGDALKDWNKDEAGNFRNADAEWKKLAPADGK